ncbi:MAG: hypothetical protein ACTSV3_03920 [Candidatus Thorarchaeota archaeon]|nr:MAG: hypothetical protein DRO87_08645 [Candidatus Thorarchaeota archaeon]RLI57275.1 MAG: hypothetical protein DRP09_03260 [Candidatus Thorarchaeota archaeon]
MDARSKSLIAFLLVVLFATPLLMTAMPKQMSAESSRVSVTVPSQSGLRVLFDESHTAGGSELMTPANTSFLAWMLEKNGYETETSFDQEITPGLLAGYDVFALFFPMVALTSSEVSTIVDFVNNGGGLLLVGTDNSPSTWHFNSANLNPISENFGITFNMDSWLGTDITFNEHHLTQDVSSIHVNLDYKLRACSMTVTSPATVVAEAGGDPLVAVSEYGSGKVVAVSAVAPFIMYRKLMNWQTEPDDLFQFSLNVFDWLVGNTPRHVDADGTAIIPVGSGPSLTPSVADSYTAYSGLIHDHTTHSDGQGTVEEMVWAGLMSSLDFMIITDHSYDAPVATGRTGVTGAQAARELCNTYGLSIEQFVGAELSHGHHTTGMPLQENVFASTQEEMVDGIHAQGAMATLCHPTIASQYMETYVQMEALGYDAIEVDNMGFSHGILEEGYHWPFYGASDGHSPEFVGKMINVVFVNETTGPNGRLADWDVVNAILDKRVVIVDHVTDLIYGQQVWIDLYLDRMADAEIEVANARAAVSAVEDLPGTTLAEWYLREAEEALQRGCPIKATNGAVSAQTADALNLRFQTVSPVPPILTPSQKFTLSLNISNGGPHNINFNASIFRQVGGALNGSTSQNISIQAGGWTLFNRSIVCNDVGTVLTAMVLKQFNSSSLTPTLFCPQNQIDAGRTVTYEQTTEGTIVTVGTPTERGDFRFFDHAVLIYNDGTGEKNVSAKILTVSIEADIGPYPKGTEITYYFKVYGVFGEIFLLQSGSYTVTTDPLEETTTTTTTTTGTPGQLDPLLLASAIGGTLAVVILVVTIGKRRAG